MALTADYPENISNLRNLKKLSPKRRIFAGIDQQLDDLPEDDLTGTGVSLPSFPPSPPIEEQLGNDVRANMIIPKEEIQDEDPFYKIGKNLGEISKEKQEVSATPPPVDWSKLVSKQRELNPDWNPPKEIAERVPGEKIPELPPEPFQSAQEQVPEATSELPVEQNLPIPPEETPKEPGSYAEIGATEKALESPNVKAEMDRIFGTITPEMKQLATDYEKAIDAELKGLSDAEANLTELQSNIKKRIENRDLTNFDKIAMAIALIAPAIVGGIFGGAEGLLGAIAGGGEAASKALLGREKGFKEDEQSLADLSMAQAKLGTQKLEATARGQEMKQKLLDNIGNKKIRELVKDDLGIVKNEDGKEELVIDTGNPLIPLKTSAIRDESDLKRFKDKVLPVLKTRLGNTEQAMAIISQLDDMLKLAQSQRSIPGSGIAGALFNPMKETYVDPETGKKVRISEQYESLREQLSDLYGQSVGSVGAKQAPASYREHFLKILPNPFTISSITKGSGDLDTVISQLGGVRKKFENSLIDSFKDNGVETSPIKSLFSSMPINISKNKSMQDREDARQAVEAAKSGKNFIGE